MKRSEATALIAAGTLLAPRAAFAASGQAICYNCPPEWADWATELREIKAHTGVSIPTDNKNSGQAVAQLIAERSSPVADMVYYGVTFGIQAKNEGIITPYKPAGWNTIPDGLKDPDGYWWSVHSGTLGFFVNVDALQGKPVPRSWHDLLKPDYKGMIGYLDPASAFVGYAAAVAANRALGGTLENMTPGISYFKELQRNSPIVPKQTAYARVLSGEIPILFDYDFNAYRARYTDKAHCVFVIPAEGTIVVPYVMSLVKNSPNPADAKRALDFILSDAGQSVWADAYLRPIRPSAISREAEARFLPRSDYARAGTVDYERMAQVEKAFGDRYLAEVH